MLGDEFIKKGEVTWKTLRHLNGNIYFQIPYVNDEKHGLETWFYSNGNIDCQIHWSNGKLHGLESYFYEDGSFNRLSKYKDNKMKLWTKFSENNVINPKTIKLNLRNKKAYVKT